MRLVTSYRRLSHSSCSVPWWTILSFIALLLLLVPCKVSSQLLGEDLLGRGNKTELSFDLVQGFMIVDVTLDLIPLRFIVDTGAGNTILFDRYYAELFGYPYADTLQVTGSDLDSSLVGYIVRGGNFWISDDKQQRKVQRDFIALSEDYMNLEESIGHKIDGILGGDFFKRLTLHINYKRRKITLSRPNTDGAKNGYSAHPIEIINGKPYITLTVSTGGSDLPLRFLIDTGAAITLLIDTASDTLIDIPAGSIHAFLGKGLSGNIQGHIGLLETLQLAPYTFTSLITNFQAVSNPQNVTIHRNGLLGSLLLSKFHVELDYAHGMMYLKPNKDFKKPIDTDKSGLILHAYGPDLNHFIVHYVYPHSAAAYAGLKKGDMITKLGRCKTSRSNLDKVMKKLRGKTGKEISVTFMRSSTEMQTTLTLKPLLTGTTPTTIEQEPKRVNPLGE